MNGPAIARWCAAAVLWTPDGRYLMQRRDDKPGLILRDHWALFGGSVDPGEDGEAAMRRELLEELEFRVREAAFLTELTISLPFPDGPRWDRMSFFAVPVTERDIAAMVLHEGQAMRLFTPGTLADEAKIAPWDLCAVLMHARRSALFADPR
jgi:8-oxo-dGTP pyrophosphatase MutT (NUDIX family)